MPWLEHRARSCRSSRRRPPRRRRAPRWSARGGRRPSIARPRSSRATPRSCSAARASRPRNVALGPAHDPAEARPAAVVMPGAQLVAVQRAAPPRGAACRGRPARPARRPPPGPRRQKSARALGRHGDLDAVLAGVAGAGDEALDAVPGRTGPRGSARRPPPRASPVASSAAGRRALHGDDGPLGRDVDRRRSPSAATTRSVFDALGMTSKRSSSTHHTMMSSSTEASSSSSRWVYCARPGLDLAQVVGERRLQARRRRRRPVDAHRAEVAHVEDDGRGAAGQVLGERARRVAAAACPTRRTAPSWRRGRGGRRRAGTRDVTSAIVPVGARGSTRRGCVAAHVGRLSAAATSAAAVRSPRHHGGRAARSAWRRRARDFTPASGEHVEHALAGAVHHVDQLVARAHEHERCPLITRWAAAMSSPRCSRRYVERLAHRLELDAGVEQALDDLAARAGRGRQ